MHRLSSSAKFERSLTPEGFAYAFFMANNAESFDPGERMAREFPGINLALFRGAVNAGNTERQIRTLVEDAFYDSDLKSVHQTLERLAPPPLPQPVGVHRRKSCQLTHSIQAA